MPESVLIIGGLDPSGGAGLASDIKVCSFFNTYPLPVISALTYQNPKEFFGFEPFKPSQIEKQLNSILNFYNVKYAKVGMTGSGENLEKIIELLDSRKIKMVIDPVLKTSTKGNVADSKLINTLNLYAEKIFLLTPNIPEASEISGIVSENQKELGNKLKNKGFQNILVKGGHLKTPADLLISEKKEIVFKGKRIETENTRGTGCALSSAIASNLALGKNLEEAIRIAKEYLNKAMNTRYEVALPPYPLNLLLKD